MVLDHTLNEMSFNILGIFLLEEIDIILGFIIILDVDTTNSNIELTLFDWFYDHGLSEVIYSLLILLQLEVTNPGVEYSLETLLILRVDQIEQSQCIIKPSCLVKRNPLTQQNKYVVRLLFHHKIEAFIRLLILLYPQERWSLIQQRSIEISIDDQRLIKLLNSLLVHPKIVITYTKIIVRILIILLQLYSLTQKLNPLFIHLMLNEQHTSIMKRLRIMRLQSNRPLIIR